MRLSLGHSHRLQVSINKYLCRIVNVHGPDKIGIGDKWRKSDREPVLEQTKEGNGMDKYCKGMMTALPNKLYSGHHEAT